MRGFTYIELTIVILILSLAVSIVVPRVGVSTRQMEEKNLVLKVQEILQKGRLRAMNGGKVSIITLDGEKKTIELDGEVFTKIPEDVDIYGDGFIKEGSTYIARCFPDGTISAKRLEIVFQGRKKIFIEINPITGNLQWYEG